MSQRLPRDVEAQGRRADELLKKFGVTPSLPPAGRKVTPTDRARSSGPRREEIKSPALPVGTGTAATPEDLGLLPRKPTPETGQTPQGELDKSIPALAKPAPGSGRKKKPSLTSRTGKKAHDLNEDDKERFEKSKASRSGYGIYFPHAKADSAAFESLRPLSAKVLVWFQQKIRIKNIRSGGRDKKKVEPIDKDQIISFTYKEAEWRGLTHQQFQGSLKELHAYGFIDIPRPGSALKGDYTQFKISDRWKDFGTPAFENLPYPKSDHYVNRGPFQVGKKYPKVISDN